MADKLRRFVPVHVDHYQGSEYRIVAYTYSQHTGLIARFADGRAVHSIHGSLENLIEAWRRDYLELVREVTL